MKPDKEEISRTLETALNALETADAAMRPPDFRQKPGGLVYLPPSRYVIIVPDLHARGDFLRAVMGSRLVAGVETVEEDVADGRASVVCVGDAFHSERRGAERWKKAYNEHIHGKGRTPAMDMEMKESLDTLIEIARCQTSYPSRFHFLKGNHENIGNERGEGNFPFRKYAHEGAMVRDWVMRKLGKAIFQQIYTWEKALPLVAVGEEFLVCHAEPSRSYTPAEVVNAYADPDLIRGLTWTDNGEAESGSVAATLEAFFPGSFCSRIFGGHRPVRRSYELRQHGLYVQINTPDRRVVAVLQDMREFSPDMHIIDLDETDGTGSLVRGVPS